jgi:hypothetical protein
MLNSLVLPGDCPASGANPPASGKITPNPEKLPLFDKKIKCTTPPVLRQYAPAPARKGI